MERRGRGPSGHPPGLTPPVTSDDAAAALSRTVRDEGRRLLATLVRLTGSWQLAEDAVQGAVERALQSWPRVVSWYDVLLTVHDTAVVRLNRAAALAERDGPAVGLAEMEQLTELGSYSLWHASRAELLRRLGRTAEADVARDQAQALSMNALQREALHRPPAAEQRWR